MKEFKFGFFQPTSFTDFLAERRPAKICLSSLFCGLMFFGMSTASFTQAPGWGRGVQLMSMNMEECKRRARGALEASGYRIEGEGGSYAEDHYFAGKTDRYTAAIACDMTSNGYMWINVFVAGTGDSNTIGAERVKLQGLMGRPGSGQQPGACGRPDFLNTTFIWNDNGRDLGTINFLRDGRAQVTWINVPHAWRTDSNGDVMVYGGGTRWVIRLTYDQNTCTFRGTRDRTSQTQDGVRTVVRPSGR